jgi:hypothetical protein
MYECACIQCEHQCVGDCTGDNEDCSCIYEDCSSLVEDNSGKE